MDTRVTPIEMQGSPLCDAATARRALDLTQPLLDAALRDRELGDSGYLHVVIMDPTRGPADSAFDEAILLEAGFGHADDPAPYASYARAKALLSWRTGLDSLEIQERCPQRLRAGDTTLGGSVALDGIVVAASGCHAVYDEALSGAVAMCLRGILKSCAASYRSAGGLFINPRDECLVAAATSRQPGSAPCNG